MSLLDTASLILTPNGYKASKLYSIKPTSGLGDMVVSRNTTATRVNSAGLLESVAFNVPRLDYTGGGCPRILVEPARTNLVLQSQTLDNASWIKTNTTVTANTTTAPDGTSTADTINLSTTADTRVAQNCSIANSTTYTLSCFFKNIALTAGQTFRLRYNNQLGSPNNFEMIATIDLAAGTATYSLVGTLVTGYSGTATGAVEEYANGWYRISVTLTTGTLAAANGQVQIIQPTASQARSFYAWGAQLETGSNATSYIPTVAATVTRNADVISKTGISSLIGQTEGTIFIDAQITNFAEAAQSFITISNGTIFNRIELRKDSSSQIFLEGAASTGSFPSFTLSSVAVGRYKIAIAYQSGNSYLYINGAQVGTTSANAFAFTSLTNIVVGANATGSTRFLNDRINLATVFPTRLSPGQLATLTTL